MFLKLLLLQLFLISTCWGHDHDGSTSKLDLLVVKKPILMNEIKTFKITLTDSWFGKDKADHFLVSAFLTAGSYYFFKEDQNISYKKSMSLSISFALSLGIVKEIRDGLLHNRTASIASIKDVVADILGIGLGIFLFNKEL